MTEYTYLRTYQRDFVLRYMRGDVPNRAILVAPTGSGKTTAVISILTHMRARSQSLKVLYVVSNGMLVKQLEYRMASLQPVTVRKSTVRETATTDSAVRNIMEQASLALVTSHDFRDSWLRRALAQAAWDFVVVDDEYLVFNSLDVVEDFLIHTDAAALMVAPSAPPLGAQSVWKVVRWDVERAPLNEGVSNYPLRIHVAPYASSADELTVLDRAREIAGLSEGVPELVDMPDFRRTARSSLYALQATCLQSVEALRSVRNELAHGRVGGGPNHAEEHNRRNVALRVMELMARLEAIIDAVDQLDRDSRFDLLVLLLTRELGLSQDDPVVVYTSEYRTRDYLIQNLRLRTDLSVGGVGDQEAAGGIRADAVIVADDGSLRGIELPARQGIAYDAQQGHSDAYVRLARLQPRGLDRPVEYWLLTDISRVSEDDVPSVEGLFEWIRDVGRLLVQGEQY